MVTKKSKPQLVGIRVEHFSMTRIEATIPDKPPEIRYFINSEGPLDRAQQMLTELIINVSKEEAIAAGKVESDGVVKPITP